MILGQQLWLQCVANVRFSLRYFIRTIPQYLMQIIYNYHYHVHMCACNVCICCRSCACHLLQSACWTQSRHATSATKPWTMGTYWPLHGTTLSEKFLIYVGVKAADHYHFTVTVCQYHILSTSVACCFGKRWLSAVIDCCWYSAGCVRLR